MAATATPSGVIRSAMPEKTPLLHPSRSSHFHGDFSSLEMGQRRRYASLDKKGFTTVAAAISEKIFIAAPEITSVPQMKPPMQLKVRIFMTVKKDKAESWTETILDHLFFNPLETLEDKLGKNISMELVSRDVDPRTRRPKISREIRISEWSEKNEKKKVGEERAILKAELTIDSSFGTPGAILVTNRRHREFFVEKIVVEGFLSGAVHFNCHSWVQPNSTNPEKRVFFSDTPYLPSDTPAGLRELRQKELESLRGDGYSERKRTDRIYDYDVYNDLGNPDKAPHLARPPLGGEKLPFPRRCRTGRQTTESDSSAECRVEEPDRIYVPRDEAFEEERMEMLNEGKKKAALRVTVPAVVAGLSDGDFGGFYHVDSLYKDELQKRWGISEDILGKHPLISKFQDNSHGKLLFDTPMIISKDKLAWMRDDEFARQAIAGINPVNIEKLERFPLTSKLDPSVYGPPESAIKEEHIIGHLEGMTVQQALEEKKLFALDYHDIYLPFLERINAQDGRKSYATRTIFFLTSLGTLKPIAIELCLPPGSAPSRARRVMTPPRDATTTWLWQMAKAHVISNDAGVHQLVNHFLRTHAIIEPFILATNRNLSAMHPVFKLLEPHMRYTLETNAMARQILVSAGGVIESFFTPGEISMEMGSAAYASTWRFDMESLPADLIRRGMAEPDPRKPHGLRLTIEDYPYANDGLLIWDALKTWVSRYVEAHYRTDNQISSDVELQTWYAETVQVGHADLSQAHWWPKLQTRTDLIGILTTLIWLASAQHAALNFGQYPIGGYIPGRPPIMRRLIPEEGDPEYQRFVADPQKYFASSLPSLLQTTMFMTVIDTLSTHSSDEEYLGEKRLQPYDWSPEVAEAFNEFAAQMRSIEEEINRRNADPRRRNRSGAGVLPYELLIPSSGPGATGRGVPNSVSI